MFIEVTDNCWINPDHVEMINKREEGPITITLRSGRRFIIHDTKEIEIVLRKFGGVS